MPKFSEDALCLYFKEKEEKIRNREPGAVDPFRFVTIPKCNHPEHDSNRKGPRVGGYRPKCGGQYSKCEVLTFRAQIGL